MIGCENPLCAGLAGFEPTDQVIPVQGNHTMLDEGCHEFVPVRGLTDHIRIHSEKERGLFDGVVILVQQRRDVLDGVFIVMHQLRETLDEWRGIAFVLHGCASSRIGLASAVACGITGRPHRSRHDDTNEKPTMLFPMIHADALSLLWRFFG
jgi:hypothetical protein